MFHALLTFFASTYASVFGIVAGPPLHDPLAVAVILDALGAEDFGFCDRRGDANEDGDESVRWIVRVVTDGEHERSGSEEAAGAAAGDAVNAETADKDAAGKRQNQLGRTILVRQAGRAEAGVRVPRGIQQVDRFWDVVGEALGRAEEAVRGGRVWEGW